MSQKFFVPFALFSSLSLVVVLLITAVQGQSLSETSLGTGAGTCTKTPSKGKGVTLVEPLAETLEIKSYARNWKCFSDQSASASCQAKTETRNGTKLSPCLVATESIQCSTLYRPFRVGESLFCGLVTKKKPATLKQDEKKSEEEVKEGVKEEVKDGEQEQEQEEEEEEEVEEVTKEEVKKEEKKERVVTEGTGAPTVSPAPSAGSSAGGPAGGPVGGAAGGGGGGGGGGSSEENAQEIRRKMAALNPSQKAPVAKKETTAKKESSKVSQKTEKTKTSKKTKTIRQTESDLLKKLKGTWELSKVYEGNSAAGPFAKTIKTQEKFTVSFKGREFCDSRLPSPDDPKKCWTFPVTIKKDKITTSRLEAFGGFMQLKKSTLELIEGGKTYTKYAFQKKKK